MLSRQRWFHKPIHVWLSYIPVRLSEGCVGDVCLVRRIDESRGGWGVALCADASGCGCVVVTSDGVTTCWTILSAQHWSEFLSWLCIVQATRYAVIFDLLLAKPAVQASHTSTISLNTCWRTKLKVIKDTGTKACLRERILGRAYFNEGVCDVNHNSLQFSSRILVCTIMRPAVTAPHIDWF